MNTYRQLQKKPTTFRLLTGLSVSEFDDLLRKLEVAFQQSQNYRQHRPNRQRQAGGGRHHALGLAERLLMLLIYYRTYVSQEFLGFLFQIHKANVCRSIQQIALLLTGIFRIPEKRVTISEAEIREAFVDATEQPIHRPEKKQRQSYSGKKKDIRSSIK